MKFINIVDTNTNTHTNLFPVKTKLTHHNCSVCYNYYHNYKNKLQHIKYWGDLGHTLKWIKKYSKIKKIIKLQKSPSDPLLSSQASHSP